MAIEHANSFVENIFESDEFLKNLMDKRDFAQEEYTDEETENKKLIEIANDMGFKFDIAEYKAACKTYMSNLDGWDAAQKVFHVLKVVSTIYKESMYD